MATYKVVKPTFNPEKDSGGKETGKQVKTLEVIMSGLDWQLAKKLRKGTPNSEIIKEI
jgi:hypothetical protein